MRTKLLAYLAVCTLVALSACSDEKVVPQSSPCVGLDNSPCGPKRPVNGTLNSTVDAGHVVLTRA